MPLRNLKYFFFLFKKKRKPVACGITSLGYDHCNILGNKIEEIAWQKAGIFKVRSWVPKQNKNIFFLLQSKNNTIAVTIDNQIQEALAVLKQRAIEKNVILKLEP